MRWDLSNVQTRFVPTFEERDNADVANFMFDTRTNKLVNVTGFRFFFLPLFEIYGYFCRN